MHFSENMSDVLIIKVLKVIKSIDTKTGGYFDLITICP